MTCKGQYEYFSDKVCKSDAIFKTIFLGKVAPVLKFYRNQSVGPLNVKYERKR